MTSGKKLGAAGGLTALFGNAEGQNAGAKGKAGKSDGAFDQLLGSALGRPSSVTGTGAQLASSSTDKNALASGLLAGAARGPAKTTSEGAVKPGTGASAFDMDLEAATKKPAKAAVKPGTGAPAFDMDLEAATKKPTKAPVKPGTGAPAFDMDLEAATKKPTKAPVTTSSDFPAASVPDSLPPPALQTKGSEGLVATSPARPAAHKRPGTSSFSAEIVREHSLGAVGMQKRNAANEASAVEVEHQRVATKLSDTVKTGDTHALDSLALLRRAKDPAMHAKKPTAQIDDDALMPSERTGKRGDTSKGARSGATTSELHAPLLHEQANAMHAHVGSLAQTKMQKAEGDVRQGKHGADLAVDERLKEADVVGARSSREALELSRPPELPQLPHAQHDAFRMAQQPANPLADGVGTNVEMTPVMQMPLPMPPDESTRVSGALLTHSAHLQLDPTTTGISSVHLRMQDGSADVRVVGAGAENLRAHESDLRIALAQEGLSLGNLDLQNQSRGNERHTYQDARDHREAASLRSDTRPTPSQNPERSSAVRSPTLVHVKA